MGRVYLVGAGPGEAGLITVKGLRLLKQCDAVVYDRLASEELLSYVKSDCRKIYVGKQAGHHSKTQEEINGILADCAESCEMVVRLKGGDPFVFGRGGEEIEALKSRGIAWEVVPGVTSSIAVPECAGIPVTHRGISRSFHVITGHTNRAQGQPVCDYRILAKTEGTLVFLMGLSHLDEITRGLMEAGKSKETPAAVISEGTTPHQQVVRGMLKDIRQKVKESSVVSPAVIVVGETAGLDYWYRESHREMEGCCGMEEKTSLTDSRNQKFVRRIGITATKLLYQKLKDGLKQVGMQPELVCGMELCDGPEREELAKEIHHLREYQWILFTSANGVAVFFDTFQKEQADIRSLGHLRFAVIGSGTADKLKEYGIQADFIPFHYTVSALAGEFAKIVGKAERVLIPRALQGSTELTEVLKEQGISYRELAIYDVAGRLTGNAGHLEELDYLVFASASGVRAFFQGISDRQIELPPHIKLACIGEITRSELGKEYGGAQLVAAVPSVQSLIGAILEHEQKNGGE